MTDVMHLRRGYLYVPTWFRQLILCRFMPDVPAPPPVVPGDHLPLPPAAKEPHDPWVYRLAVGGVSLALFAFLLGAAIVGASGHVKDMTQEYWTIGAALSGALVGMIVPSPTQKKAARIQKKEAKIGETGPDWVSLSQPLLLIVVLAGSMWLETKVNAADAAQLRALAAATAGALVGLLAQSPGKGAPKQ
jgi:hypothetical protein